MGFNLNGYFWYFIKLYGVEKFVSDIFKVFKCYFTCIYTGQMFKSSVFMESYDFYLSFSSRLQKTDPVLKIVAFRDERGSLENSLRALILPF